MFLMFFAFGQLSETLLKGPLEKYTVSAHGVLAKR